MATTTTTDTTDTEQKAAQIVAIFKPLGVVGLCGSILIQYFAAVAIIDQLLKAGVVTLPPLLSAVTVTSFLVVILATLIVLANSLMGMLGHNAESNRYSGWQNLILVALGIATVTAPLLFAATQLVGWL